MVVLRCFLLSCVALSAQTVKPGDEQLWRALERAGENLRRMPNYTCLQTIERSRHASAGQPWELLDRVRLEVALVNGREMFAWPGGSNFEDRELADIVPGGAIGNGNFALHARSVFLTGTAEFSYAGERVYEGRRSMRWDFKVPRARSGYQLRNGELRGIVGFHGSFWVDESSFDLVRLEVHADDIPPHLEIVAASDAIDYARIPIGGEEFLLPRASELRIAGYSGESRNVTAFSGCRQYTGESVLKFEEEDAGTAAAAQAETVTLAPATKLHIGLTSEIRTEGAAIGDAVRAKLRGALKQDGRVLFPKGSEITGRILWMRLSGTQQPHYMVGLNFEQIRSGNRSALIMGGLAEVLTHPTIVSRTPVGRRVLGGVTVQITMDKTLLELPGIVFVRPGDILLPSGLELLWVTKPTG